MRIALVSPLDEAVPPRLYGGTERVVACLAEALMDGGHDVTLFASGDSRSTARLMACCPRGLRLEARRPDPLVYRILQMEAVMSRLDDFDVVHVHSDTLHYPFARRSPVPMVTTLHGRQDLPDLIPLYMEFDDVALISISDAQRRPIPWANWIGTVHHGLPADRLPFAPAAGSYLAFLGRFSPEKGFPRAVEIARRTGLPLKAAAKADAYDQDYFEAVIRPLLKDPLVEWVGEVDETEKAAFLGGALALLFPIDWPEPFGLVMIEAMACGTPTIAWPWGSVPEVLEPGVTGFVVRSVEEGAAAVGACAAFDRARCRAAFERGFSASRMAADYLALYRWLAAEWGTPTGRTPARGAAAGRTAQA